MIQEMNNFRLQRNFVFLLILIQFLHLNLHFDRDLLILLLQQ
jgi:hypothetical protein